MKPRISVIIPTHNEEATIERCLSQFSNIQDVKFEVVVSDSSSDGTPRIVDRLREKVNFSLNLLKSTAGRAVQMNHAARLAQGEILLFLHADTMLPKNAFSLIDQAFERGKEWGGFHIEFFPTTSLLRFVAWRSNLRLRVWKIVFGDQALFVSNQHFKKCGGFPKTNFLEDILICRQLRRSGPMARITNPVISSSRRFLEGGVLRTYLTMTLIMILFFLRIKPDTIKRWVYGA